MTREEAKRRLLDIERCTPIHTREDARDFEALEMAIQALSQEPTEKPMTVDEMEREYEKSKALFHKIVECDDAISREAVCNIVNDIRDCISVEGYWAILERLKKLPSVTQKSGKWIGIDEEPHEDYECSCCGYVVSTFTANIEPHTEYKYCPNCGAKMVEPQERSRK